LDQYADYVSHVAYDMEGVMVDAFHGMADALVDFTMTGKGGFTDLANSIIRDILRIYIQSQLLKPIAENMAGGDWIGKAVGWIGNTIGGGGYSGTSAIQGGSATLISQWGVSGLAKGGFLPTTSQHVNTILTKPTFIPFAAGGVLAGEAGKEAVLPVARMPSGNLGVEASTGTSNVKVELVNRTGQDVKMSQGRTRMDGKELVVPIFLDALENNYMGLREALGG
jgi:lambda family phage tail tape measure protein